MRILDILTDPWAILETKLAEIFSIYDAHIRREKIDFTALEARLGQPLENNQQGYTIHQGVAVLPLEGVIGKRMNLLTRISGGTSTEMFANDFVDAQQNSDVKTIIILADTPGGSVDGTELAADVIYSYRGGKPIITLADGMMASAGYWIGSAADQIYVANQTTNVGSIGVLAKHVDKSKALAREGITVTEFFAGKYKTVGSEFKPLSKEDKQVIQDKVDYIYSIFVDTVARNLGVDPQTVLTNMADGRVFMGQQAIDAGLVHGMASLDQLINQYAEKSTTVLLSGVDARQSNIETVSVEDDSMPIKEKKNPSDDQTLEIDVEEIRRQAREEALQAESARITALMNVPAKGYESLVQAAIKDGKTTAGELSLQILNEKEKTVSIAASDYEADAAELDTVVSNAQTEPKTAPVKQKRTSADMPIEEIARQEWDSDPSLRASFSGTAMRDEAGQPVSGETDFDAYLAYRMAESNGQIRFIRQKENKL